MNCRRNCNSQDSEFNTQNKFIFVQNGFSVVFHQIIANILIIWPGSSNIFQHRRTFGEFIKISLLIVNNYTTVGETLKITEQINVTRRILSNDTRKVEIYHELQKELQFPGLRIRNREKAYIHMKQGFAVIFEQTVANMVSIWPGRRKIFQQM